MVALVALVWHKKYLLLLLFACLPPVEGTEDNLTTNGAMGTDVLKAGLLGAYNYVHGSRLEAFGAGEVATELCMGLVAHTLMEVRRFLEGDFNSKPTRQSKKGGNTLAAKHVELEEKYQAAYSELDKAMRDGVCQLETSGEVLLMRSRTLGALRALGNTLTERQQKQLLGN